MLLGRDDYAAWGERNFRRGLAQISDSPHGPYAYLPNELGRGQLAANYTHYAMVPCCCWPNPRATTAPASAPRMTGAAAPGRLRRPQPARPAAPGRTARPAAARGAAVQAGVAAAPSSTCTRSTPWPCACKPAPARRRPPTASSADAWRRSIPTLRGNPMAAPITCAAARRCC